MRKVISLIAVLIITSCATVFSQNVDVSGTIRSLALDSWMVLNNSNHAPVNILSVVSYPTYIRVYYTFTARKVHFLIATTDDTFAGSGYFIGASVGLSYSNIFIYKMVGGVMTIVNPQMISSGGGNIWIHGEFEK
jgi:hypothetical protein